MFVSVHHGYGHHNTNLEPSQYIQVVKFEVIGQIFAVLAYPPGKAAVAVCLMRIFPGKKLRWLLWGVVIINVLIFVGMAILQICQCNPIRKQWDILVPGTCLNPYVSVYYDTPGASIGALSDFVLAIVPWIYITKLHLPLRERVAVGVALSLGFGAGFFAIIKTYYVTRLSARTDYAYDTVPLVMWSVSEQFAINVAACIPTLRPLLQKLAGKPLRYASGGSGSSKRTPSSLKYYRNQLSAASGDVQTLVDLPQKGRSQVQTQESWQNNQGNDVRVNPMLQDNESRWDSEGIQVTRTYGVTEL